MKVLITGATGLVGNGLIKILLQNGISVNYLTTSRNKIANETNYKGFFWNPIADEINENAFDEVDVIIHLAGANVANRWTTSYKQEIIDSRVKTTKLLYKTLDKINHQVKQVISASAIGIYPNSLNQVYQEDFSKVDDSFLGRVVNHWENEVTEFEKLSIKFKELRSLSINYKDDKETEIGKLKIELNEFKTKVEQSKTSYDEVLDKTTKSIEKFIESVESDKKQNIQ